MTSKRTARRLWPAAIVLAGTVAAGTASAAAVIVVQGRGELVSQPLTGDLQVLEVRLEPMLVPGKTSDLVVKVRNRSALTVVTDRVRLKLPLTEARPAGCLSKVSGPLLASAGVTLSGAQRAVVAAGSTGQIVLPAALRLAAGATGGCGFRVQVDIIAVPAPPTTRPTMVPPTTVPPTTTRPTTVPPTTTTPNPTQTTPPPPTTTTEPTIPAVTPPPPVEDCDPFDPDCATG